MLVISPFVDKACLGRLKEQADLRTLVSRSEEGLDFHRYCHAVVHWNLPSNPIDLEQREGRVHRYKGHAVRKNVASLVVKNG